MLDLCQEFNTSLSENGAFFPSSLGLSLSCPNKGNHQYPGDNNAMVSLVFGVGAIGGEGEKWLPSANGGKERLGFQRYNRRGFFSEETYPSLTDKIRILGLQNAAIDEIYVVWKRRPTNIKALKLPNVRSGYEARVKNVGLALSWKKWGFISNWQPWSS